VRQALQGLFQLTTAEAKLAESLYEGRSLNEIADANAVSIHTVRNQLKSALSKTDTRRQGELVALVAQVASLAGR
jgi:DNA-binding CsgD family transcriptional regulator